MKDCAKIVDFIRPLVNMMHLFVTGTVWKIILAVQILRGGNK